MAFGMEYQQARPRGGDMDARRPQAVAPTQAVDLQAIRAAQGAPVQAVRQPAQMDGRHVPNGNAYGWHRKFDEGAMDNPEGQRPAMQDHQRGFERPDFPGRGLALGHQGQDGVDPAVLAEVMRRRRMMQMQGGMGGMRGGGMSPGGFPANGGGMGGGVPMPEPTWTLPPQQGVPMPEPVPYQQAPPSGPFYAQPDIGQPRQFRPSFYDLLSYQGGFGRQGG